MMPVYFSTCMYTLASGSILIDRTAWPPLVTPAKALGSGFVCFWLGDGGEDGWKWLFWEEVCCAVLCCWQTPVATFAASSCCTWGSNRRTRRQSVSQFHGPSCNAMQWRLTTAGANRGGLGRSLRAADGGLELGVEHEEREEID